MPFDHLDNELRVRARDLIGQGHLPRKPPERLWGGRGTGQRHCSLCTVVIAREEVEFELEHHAGESVQVTTFHFLCYAAWQLECTRDESLKRISP
jgi:hypothetical protein